MHIPVDYVYWTHDAINIDCIMVPYIVGAFENGERINHEALYEELWEKLFNSRNMKHHVFRKGDLLLMDQLHTTHRRSPVKRKIRKLWRCAFDYSNIDFT